MTTNEIKTEQDSLGVTPVVNVGQLLNVPSDITSKEEIGKLASKMLEFVAEDKDTACQEITYESAANYWAEKKIKVSVLKPKHQVNWTTFQLLSQLMGQM